MPAPETQPPAKTFSAGLEFIRENTEADYWYLQIETFDPRDPFFSLQEFKNLYPKIFDEAPPRLAFDWPSYKPLTESDQYVQHTRIQYAALLSMCDRYLGARST